VKEDQSRFQARSLKNSLSLRERAGVRALVPAVLLLTALPLLATPDPKPASKHAPKPPIDFTGTWELDPKMSVNVSAPMQGAVLSVTQDGDRIWISPVQTPGKTRTPILAEEIVADGRAYEKALGPAGKGLVTAGWAKDGKSLWIEVEAGPPENPRAALQRSVWKVSTDRKVWVRESVSLQKGNAKSARLVFRRKDPEKK
jgi:hypothetical protein